MSLEYSYSFCKQLDMSNQYVVIMAGGRGERFWPQSRAHRPKHLLPIVGDREMLVQTIERLLAVLPAENILIITNEQQRAAVADVCDEISLENIIAEPVGRDTAAAVGLAMVLVKQRNPDGVFAMLPADAVIHDTASFQRTLRLAFEVAVREKALVTIGIQPSFPATGYGYLHRDAQALKDYEEPVYRVLKFVEKPDVDVAQGYLDAGDYFWNAGMFVWTVAAIERAFSEFTPGLYKALLAIESSLISGGSLDSVLSQHYPNLKKVSIDYAIMEKANNVFTLAASFDWDDVGEWAAVARHFPADQEGNVLRGEALVKDGSNNIVIGKDGHLVALLGVDDLIVVHTDDATLVCPKNKAQEIKALVQHLGKHPKWQQLV